MEHAPWKTKICTRHQGCTDVVTLDDVFIVCVRGDKPEVAEAIVREHNAHDDLLAACEWIGNFILTAKDGGDAWCAVRGQPGAKEWADGLKTAIAKATT